MSFYAPFEVDQQLAGFRARLPGQAACRDLLAILSWCLANTARAIAENLPYWAAQGMTRSQRQYAYDNYYDRDDPECCDLDSLSSACAEDEKWSLQEMYGQARGHRPMPAVVYSMIRRRARAANREDVLMEGGVEERIMKHVEELAKAVLCPTSLLQEEQERELEAEQEEDWVKLDDLAFFTSHILLEFHSVHFPESTGPTSAMYPTCARRMSSQEREVERPQRATPATPQVSAGLLEPLGSEEGGPFDPKWPGVKIQIR